MLEDGFFVRFFLTIYNEMAPAYATKNQLAAAKNAPSFERGKKHRDSGYKGILSISASLLSTLKCRESWLGKIGKKWSLTQVTKVT